MTRLVTESPPPRAAVLVLAHRRDGRGLPWAAASLGDGHALGAALGTAVTAGLAPAIVTIAPGDPRPADATHVLELDPATEEPAALAAAAVVLETLDRPPEIVLVVPVEQPLSSATLLWTLVSTSERHGGARVAAGSGGRPGHPWAIARAGLVTPSAPVVVEAGEAALFWSAQMGDASAPAIAVAAERLRASVSSPIVRLGRDTPELDELAVEEPVEIRLNGRPFAVVMRTPGHDDELALGFLLTEAVVDRSERVLELAVKGNRVEVAVPEDAIAAGARRREFLASSSCGVCGKTSIDEVVLRFAALSSRLTIARATLVGLPDRLGTGQSAFARTGGLHAAALCLADGTVEVVREDVGRHNAVDKVVGWAARRGRLPLRDDVLVVSGRIGFEIAQKAKAAGIPIVAAVGAPSSLAVDLAERCGMTLVGFLRQGRGNVYTHPERIV